MTHPHRWRNTAVFAALAVLFAVSIIGLGYALRHDNKPAAAPTATTITDPGWSPSPPVVPDDVHIAWAYLDSTEGDQWFGGDVDLHELDQLVIPGLVADRLEALDQGDSTPSPSDVATLSAALTGDAVAAAQLVADAGGVDDAFGRIIDACSLTYTRLDPARGSATDVARYAACLREGGIANPKTAGWVLDQMRNNAGGIGAVRGTDVGQRLAQFNSTVPGDADRMRTGCMAAGPYWSAAVLVDWPAGRPELYGVDQCTAVARAQFPPDTQKAPDSPAPDEPSPTCPYDTCRGTD